MREREIEGEKDEKEREKWREGGREGERLTLMLSVPPALPLQFLIQNLQNRRVALGWHPEGSSTESQCYACKLNKSLKYTLDS